MEESNSLKKEMSQGHDLAKQLQKLLLDFSSPPETRDSLLQGILSCYDRAISSLIQNAPSVSSGKRKRKDEGDRTETVRAEGGGQHAEDGYSWRKYGQKRILGCKYPRGYFRCTHRPVQGCLATKLVQRSDDDPSVFQVTYRGRHTCISPIVSTPSIPDDAGTTVEMDAKEHTFPPFSLLETPGIMAEENGTSSNSLAAEGTLFDDFDFDPNSPVVFSLYDLGFDLEFPFEDLEFLS